MDSKTHSRKHEAASAPVSPEFPVETVAAPEAVTEPPAPVSSAPDNPAQTEAEAPKAKNRWIEVRLVKKPKGSRRRLVRVGTSYVRFNASQEDEKQQDFPKKVLYVSELEFKGFTADPDYVVREIKKPEPKKNSLGFGLGRRSMMDGERIAKPETKES